MLSTTPSYGLMMGISGWIMFSDISSRRISNPSVIMIALLALVMSGFSAFAMIPFIIATLSGFILFGLGVFGGGDIKLMLAFLPGIDTQWWLVVFLLAAFIGGIMAMGYLITGWYKKNLTQVRKRGIPYGVPIAISGLFGVLLTVT